MDTVVFVAVSILLVIVSFCVGYCGKRTREKLDNQAVLQERAQIQSQIQVECDKLARIEEEYQEKRRLMNDARDSAQQAYDDKVQSLDTDYKHYYQDLYHKYCAKRAEYGSEFDEAIDMMELQKAEVQEELDSLRRTREAAIEAARKEREVQEQPDKYRVPMTDDEINDIEYLTGIMPKLKYPEVLGKCIWSVFYQKKMKSFFAGILGPNEVCGIYKITDQITGEAYVGQSVSIQKRWQEHIKCGVGAMPSSNANQLYAAMKRDGVWNFTFELLVACGKEELDDQERRFIELYNTDTLGLNSRQGNQSNTLRK